MCFEQLNYNWRGLFVQATSKGGQHHGGRGGNGNGGDNAGEGSSTGRRRNNGGGGSDWFEGEEVVRYEPGTCFRFCVLYSLDFKTNRKKFWY